MLIIGKSGRLAQTFAKLAGSQVSLHGRDEVNLSLPATLHTALDRLASSHSSDEKVLINAAAFTNVDLAQTSRDEAHQTNVIAPALMAEWAQANGYAFVHYSTDYVYEGTGRETWREDDAGRPVNFYGRTKLEGERAVVAACVRHLIFRTTWLYGVGDNFLRYLLKQAASQKSLQVVNDQIGGPTYLEELVRCSVRAINQSTETTGEARWGIYNLVNSGYVSKCDLSIRFFQLLHESGAIDQVPAVLPVASAFFPTPAERPLNSRLSLDKFHKAFGFEPKNWEQSLSEWVAQEFRIAQ